MPIRKRSLLLSERGRHSPLQPHRIGSFSKGATVLSGVKKAGFFFNKGLSILLAALSIKHPVKIRYPSLSISQHLFCMSSYGAQFVISARILRSTSTMLVWILADV